MNYLAHHGVHRLALNRMAPVGRGKDCEATHVLTDVQYTRCLTDCYLTMVDSGFRFQVKPIIDWARKIVSPQSQSHGCYQCGAGWSHLSIDPLGNVYACDRFTFDPQWVSGNLLEQPLLDIMNESKMHACRTRTERIPQCGSCPVRHVCGGSCAVTSYYRHSTIDVPGHECGNMQLFIPWLERRLANHDDERIAIEAMVLGYDPERVFYELRRESEATAPNKGP